MTWRHFGSGTARPDKHLVDEVLFCQSKLTNSHFTKHQHDADEFYSQSEGALQARLLMQPHTHTSGCKPKMPPSSTAQSTECTTHRFLGIAQEQQKGLQNCNAIFLRSCREG